jgi:MFS family permease
MVVGPGAGKSHQIPSEPEYTAWQALRCQAFWFLSIAFSIRHLVASAIAVHEAPFLRDRGYNAEEAATLLGATILVSASGRLFWGWLGDRWDRRYIVAVASLLMAVGVLVMTTIPDVAQAPVYHFGILAFGLSDVLVGGFIVLFGFGYGGTIPVSIAMIADYFGRRNYATIQGTSGVVTMFGNVAGPVLAGYAFDVSNSYGLVLTVFAFVTILGVPFILLARRPQWNVSGALTPS